MQEGQWRPAIEKQNKNLCAGLAEALEADIAAGVLKPNDKLPPQRELADLLQVNVSTVARAFKQCELKGLIYGVVGRGTFVAPDATLPLLMEQSGNTAMIDLGQVLPLYHMDCETIKQARDILLDMDMEHLIRYAEPQGRLSHRRTGAEWLKTFNLSAGPEDIVITPGSQSAVATALLTLFNPGDRIAVEALTYSGFKSLAALYGIRLVPVEMTAEGISIQGLLNACKNEDIKGIYLMPEMQNPTTVAIPAENREKLAEIIRRYRLILLEDDAYAYTGNPDSIPISALVPEYGIYAGGTAKLLGPGFRISFVKVPELYMNAFKSGLQSTTWMASPVTAEIVSRLITSGQAEAAARRKRDEASKRNVLARGILSGYEPASRPSGFFQWLKLPESWRGQGRMLEITAREAGVRVYCAEKFAVGGAPVPQAVRLALSGPDTMGQLEKGLKLLRGILNKGYSQEPVL